MNPKPEALNSIFLSKLYDQLAARYSTMSIIINYEKSGLCHTPGVVVHDMYEQAKDLISFLEENCKYVFDSEWLERNKNTFLEYSAAFDKLYDEYKIIADERKGRQM